MSSPRPVIKRCANKAPLQCAGHKRPNQRQELRMPWPVNEIEHERTRETERSCPVPSQSHPMMRRRIPMLVSEFLEYDHAVDRNQDDRQPMVFQRTLHHLTRHKISDRETCKALNALRGRMANSHEVYRTQSRGS